jgi:ubiquinone/menaquinone biosynthesis C-methylase UbiE
MGVGAFARRILQLYPGASGHGIDLEAEAVTIAARVLPRARMNVSVGTMVDLRFESRSFDYVFVPGCLCYLRTLDQVETFLRLMISF